MKKVSDEVQRATGVSRRTESNIWQWGIKSPKDLRHLYPGQWAHRCSLETADLRAANELAAAMRAQWLARFAEQRKAATAQPIQAITPELGRTLAERLYAALMAGDAGLRDDPATSQKVAAELHRAVPRSALLIPGPYAPPADLTAPLHPLDGRPPVVQQVLADLNIDALAGAATAQAAQSLRAVLPMVQAQAAALGVKLDENTPGIRDALKEALKAQLRARSDIARRDAGEVIETPPLHAPRAGDASGTPGTLREVFVRWRAAKVRSPDAVNACERALALFEERFRAPRLQDITRAMGDGAPQAPREG